MAVTAGLVKELRDRTGAGMMECKKALVETEGNLEAAIEHLRKTGLAKADKKAGRTAAEGKIVVAQSERQAVLVEVNCETDFVAKDENFVKFADAVARTANTTGIADVAQLLGQNDAITGTTLEQTRQTLVAKLGENIQVRRAVVVQGGEHLGAYLHGGRIGVLVEMEGGDASLAKDIAMHVAASRPAYISSDDIPADETAKEKDILVAQVKDSGKPDDIIEKMVAGRLRKHFAEITLLGQAFVKNPDQTIAQLLKENNAKVTGFHRLEVGEGIEKKADNFAEEVMAQVRGT